MLRKRKPLSQLTIGEAKLAKKPRKSTRNANTVKSDDGIQPRAGTISRMILKNFMCHDHLEVTFDHNINYVIGRNGSGKSAILTALFVGLGGKAALTNRGNSIKGFVKAGKNSASVAITLRNEGLLTYRPNIFGKEITILRNFSVNGSSSYKIKSASGEIITTQSKEIQRICRNFNIQIDNPICLLNQDTSRNFLNSKDPHQKFILFMRATHLQDLLDEYKKIFANRKEAIRLLNEKETLYANLRKELKELQRKVENHKSITKIKDHLKVLQREFYWAKVKDSEEDLNVQQKAVQQIQNELTSVRNEIAELDDRAAGADDKIRELQLKVQDLQQSIESQNQPQNSLVRVLGSLKEIYESKYRERRVILKDVAVKTGNCNILQQEISTLKANMTQKEQEKAQRLSQIENLEEKLRGVEALLETSKNDQFQTRNSLARLQDEDDKFTSELQQIDIKIDNTKSRLNSFKGENNNTLSLYGNHMHRVVEAIKAHEKKFVHLPRGPLGSYIKLKDKNWDVAVEGFFGANLLRAFTVDNKRDNEVLMSILQHLWSGPSKPMIITSKFFFEVHDVTPNLVRPVGGCISVFDALEVSDPIVANCLIDQTNLESVLLIPNTETAIQLMSEKHRVPNNCKQGITMKGDIYYPVPNYKTYGSRNHNARFLQVSTADMIKHLNQKLQDLHEKESSTKDSQQTLKSEVEVHSKKLVELDIKVTKIHKAQLHIKHQLDDLKSTAEPDVANIHALETELAQLKQQLIERQGLEKAIDGDIVSLKIKIQENENKLDKLKNVCRGYEDRIEPLQDQIREETTITKQFQTNKRFANKRLQECEDKFNSASRELEERRATVIRQTQEATSVGEQIESERSVPIIVEEINATQRSIAQIESEVESAEELMRKYQDTNNRYKRASEFMKAMCEDVNELKLAVDMRARYYKCTEDYCINFVNHTFQKVMECRQFKGNVEIDVDKKTLDLIVVPQHGSQGYTKTSNLSGGERSFSTVAFLYALWHCMEFPFYILDEFDVFMDKVNRTKVMDILLSYAKSCPDLQFVFLTPQDISFVHDKAVTINRLDDPERSAVGC